MKVAIFTSNQPRHLHLIKSISEIADEVFVVQECRTVFPGKVDDLYRKSDIVETYFDKVNEAEEKVFGTVGFLPDNVRTLSLKTGDLSYIDPMIIQQSLDADFIIVFGASYIKYPLIDILIERKAINIHMGVSPFFRGSSCNFWALYDGYPEYVGATIHYLSKGLDSGPMLFHAMPGRTITDPFLLGMMAVKAAHLSIVSVISKNSLFNLEPVIQDKFLEIRYSRHNEFTDEIVQNYIDTISGKSTNEPLVKTDISSKLLRPFYLDE